MSGMKEFDIRPRALFDEYLAVATKDIGLFFSDQTAFVDVDCPACETPDAPVSFVKHGLTYRLCGECGSLFMSPRPTREAIERYYRESDSSRFWAERFFPETAEARRAQVFRPRAEMITMLVDRFGVPSPRTLVDVGAGYGIFLEEVWSQGAMEAVIAIEPSADLARACRRRGFEVIEQPVETLASGAVRAAVATSFEVLEHLFAPDLFLGSIRELLLPEGLLVFTTLTVSGWDMQVLWERSKSISPPHHINLLSTEGLERLVTRVGFRVEEVATPGKLDVDIVRNMLDEDSDLRLPRFAEYLLRRRGSSTWDAFQAFLQQHCLSSHVRVVARKPA